jgi:hypothetical protein
MLTLYRIEKETGVAKKDDKKTKTEELNDFERQRFKVAEGVRMVRNVRHQREKQKKKKKKQILINPQKQTLKERDELLEQTSGNKVTVELSNAVRLQLKTVRADVEELARVQAEHAKKVNKKAKKDGLSEEDQEYLDRQKEIVELSFAHIAEVEKMEKRMHYTEGILDESSDQEAAPASLPDVDDDGEVGQRFAMLKQRDAQIDEGLEEVSKGVAVLKQMAIEMGDAVEVQGAVLDEVDKKVDKNLDKVENLNKRLKKTLETVRSGNRFALDFICCLVLLALAGVLANTVLKFT